MNNAIEVIPVAHVVGGRTEPTDDYWGGTPAIIRIDQQRYTTAAVDGLDLHVEDLDAVDGTPVLDIKPWFAEMGPRGNVRQPAWVSEMLTDYYAPRTEQP